MHRTLAATVVFAIGLSVLRFRSANADVILHYTGNPFTYVQAPFTSSDRITGRIVLSAPLGNNLQQVNVQPISYSFNDGIATFTNTSPGSQILYLYISTNNVGQITPALVEITMNTNVIRMYSAQTYSPGDLGATYNSYAQNGTPGTWTETQDTPVPEPPTGTILSTGLLGLLALARQGK